MRCSSAVHKAGYEFSRWTRDLNHYVRRNRGEPHPLLSARHVCHAEADDLEGSAGAQSYRFVAVPRRFRSKPAVVAVQR